MFEITKNCLKPFPISAAGRAEPSQGDLPKKVKVERRTSNPTTIEHLKPGTAASFIISWTARL